VEKAGELVKRFKERIRLDFVDVKEPFIISNHRDLRRLPEILTYDDDALLVGSQHISMTYGHWLSALR